jgi:Tol biopolymer transport system component
VSSAMAHKVFISYSSKDQQTAEAVCAALEGQGIACWIAPRDILPGVEYGDAIIDALSACQIVVLIFSRNANDSPQVRREVERAVSKEKILIPYRIEDVLPSGAMEFALSDTQWLDAHAPPIEHRLAELSEIVSRLSEKHSGAGDTELAAIDPKDMGVIAGSGPEPTRVRRSFPGWAWGALAVLLIAASAAVVLSGARRWGRQTSEAVTLHGHTDIVNAVSFSPDSRTLASGSYDGTVKLWSRHSRQVLRTLQGHTSVVYSVAFSPDGRTLASGSRDKTVKLWDIAGGQEPRTLRGHADGVYSVAISPDGHTLVSGSRDKTIKLWDMASGQVLQTLEGHADAVTSVAISPDGRLLASGSLDKTVKLWDMASGQLLRTLEGHADYVRSVAFSPNGFVLASGGNDDTVRLWDVSSGQLLRTLQGHTDAVFSVAFSPDGRTLASGSRDKSIKLWDVTSGQLTRTLLGHTNRVGSVAFSPDSRTLASGSDDDTIKLWSMNSEQQ